MINKEQVNQAYCNIEGQLVKRCSDARQDKDRIKYHYKKVLEEEPLILIGIAAAGAVGGFLGIGLGMAAIAVFPPAVAAMPYLVFGGAGVGLAAFPLAAGVDLLYKARDIKQCDQQLEQFKNDPEPFLSAYFKEEQQREAANKALELNNKIERERLTKAMEVERIELDSKLTTLTGKLAAQFDSTAKDTRGQQLGHTNPLTSDLVNGATRSISRSFS